ncbi:hypothetical protein HS088_TW12G01033 [Tripterygium wilfordii]|uniref:K Homology domain-containing protein n=1 Tax=Tripterygium wilfordii TaxID=458696 RepID=A0A7J7D0C9_TRIWF|nr:RNA-binding KH domain-containing protein RCF3-like [Tripterygium wilfordii]XP_038718084.1 RNA-binding KH domain-containing protein RCF3-like [Tripterygium wilfordii]XP_038718085.1 RNA-binding KH domain-containing protein RCF3-like [Tripterygium wilfordii]KAF5739822.1 hypothetical protein HS088_TW12G01033 [Tripterygium wilfordii]
MSHSLTPSKRPNDWKHSEPNAKRKWQRSPGLHPQNLRAKSSPGSASFRLLWPASRIDAVIGEGGIIAQICRETGASVTVEEAIPGCDERVVVITGSDKETEVNQKAEVNEETEINQKAEVNEEIEINQKAEVNEETEISTLKRKDDGDEEANAGKDVVDKKNHYEDDEDKKSFPVEDSKSEIESSSAQKALLLVFEKMVEAVPVTDGGDDESNKSFTHVLRLLVLSSRVGCLLGKGGSVIKQMSTDSGAQIRILPRDKLPLCVSGSDELVQITGEVSPVRKALQIVSQQLLEYASGEHDSFPSNSKGTSYHSVSHPHKRSDSYPPPHVSGLRDFRESRIPGRMKPSQEILTFRLLCHDESIGGVIGKGGAIVKTLQQETGCEITVVEAFSDSEDRIILISGPAHPDDNISPPQDALLRVQTRVLRAIPDSMDKNVLARLLVSSNQVGCLLGKSGSIMAEMRMLSRAHIRILGKDQIPKCASEDDEVVQINGDFDAVQEALLLITTKLRHHFFRDLFPSINYRSNQGFLDQVPPFASFLGRRELSPSGMYSNLGPSVRKFDAFDGPIPRGVFHPHDDNSLFMHSIHRQGIPHHMSERKAWGPQGLVEGGARVGFHDFPGLSQRRVPSFGGGFHPAIITNTTFEVAVPCSLIPVICGEDGACLKQIREISDAKITITDPKPGSTETLIIISGTPEQTHAAQSLIQAFVTSETGSS